MRRAPGFTLVELLVVIGIIALLVALLLPALNRARESAQSLQCASNLRPIGTGIELYANDWKGMYPPRPWDSTWGTDPGIGTRGWIFRLIPYLGGPKETSKHNTATLLTMRVFWCPNAAMDYPATVTDARHYGINRFIGSYQSNHRWRNLRARTRRPQEMLLVGEINYNGEAMSDTRSALYTPGWQVIQDGMTRPNNFRVSHKLNSTDGEANYLFCDGHVESIRGDISVYANPANAGRYWYWW